MRVAFYAPMKPPDDPVPSGDRTMARQMVAALRLAGHAVTLASRLRSRDGNGDPARQARLAALGARLADRLARRLRRRPPDAWFTYHVYHKAPDWIGPAVSRALGIPYVIAEASVAGKRADGPWATGYAGAAAAIRAADAVIGLNSRDAPGVLRLIGRDDRLHLLRPFADVAPFAAAAAERDRHRAALADRHGLDPSRPWLLAVAMMRPGDKLASYRVLAGALAGLGGAPWQ
ncbi:MAG: glycosyltransferase family 1 protein, partial [Rhodospirillales bacterium]